MIYKNRWTNLFKELRPKSWCFVQEGGSFLSDTALWEYRWENRLKKNEIHTSNARQIIDFMDVLYWEKFGSDWKEQANNWSVGGREWGSLYKLIALFCVYINK